MLGPQPSQQRSHGRLFQPQDLGQLEGPDREAWQRPELIMDALGIGDGSVVADLGAGGGWFTVRLAKRVGPNGLVYAEDIQREIDGMKMKRREVETTLESTIATLRNTLEFVREQEQREREDKILLHRPRPNEPQPATPKPGWPSAGEGGQQPDATAVDKRRVATGNA